MTPTVFAVDYAASFIGKYSLNYDTCTSEELHRFIKDRHLETTLPQMCTADDQQGSAVLSKSQLILALCRADRSATFRFLDLIPELRNKIYEELLVIDDEHLGLERTKKGHPQIIAACRQTQAEASSILHKHGSRRIHLMPQHIQIVGASYGRQVPRTFSLGVKKWPDFLLKLRSITIVLRPWTWCACVTRGKNRAKAWSELLFSLTCFLQTSVNLKEVIIMQRDTGKHDLWGRILQQGHRIEESTYPLSRLCAHFECKFVDFTGSVWAHLPAVLRANATTHSRVYRSNTLERAHLIERQMTYVDDLIRLPYFDGGEHSKNTDAKKELQRAHKGKTYSTVQAEVKLQALIQKLDDFLDDFLQKIQSHRKSIDGYSDVAKVTLWGFDSAESARRWSRREHLLEQVKAMKL